MNCACVDRKPLFSHIHFLETYSKGINLVKSCFAMYLQRGSGLWNPLLKANTTFTLPVLCNSSPLQLSSSFLFFSILSFVIDCVLSLDVDDLVSCWVFVLCCRGVSTRSFFGGHATVGHESSHSSVLCSSSSLSSLLHSISSHSVVSETWLPLGLPLIFLHVLAPPHTYMYTYTTQAEQRSGYMYLWSQHNQLNIQRLFLFLRWLIVKSGNTLPLTVELFLPQSHFVVSTAHSENVASDGPTHAPHHIRKLWF
jgi:hypothetical protein